jgi:hypothetical protein
MLENIRIYDNDLGSSLEGISTAILKWGNPLNLNLSLHLNQIPMTLTIDTLTF